MSGVGQSTETDGTGESFSGYWYGIMGLVRVFLPWHSVVKKGREGGSGRGSPLRRTAPVRGLHFW